MDEREFALPVNDRSRLARHEKILSLKNPRQHHRTGKLAAVMLANRPRSALHCAMRCRMRAAFRQVRPAAVGTHRLGAGGDRARAVEPARRRDAAAGLGGARGHRARALPAEELFAAFDQRPLAAASIAQVHRARLRDGGEVVVNVQRPEVGRARSLWAEPIDPSAPLPCGGKPPLPDREEGGRRRFPCKPLESARVSPRGWRSSRPSKALQSGTSIPPILRAPATL
jgi:hypothetical protein